MSDFTHLNIKQIIKDQLISILVYRIVLYCVATLKLKNLLQQELFILLSVALNTLKKLCPDGQMVWIRTELFTSLR